MHYLQDLIVCMNFLLNKLIGEHTMLAMDMKSKNDAVIRLKAKSEHDEVS